MHRLRAFIAVLLSVTLIATAGAMSAARAAPGAAHFLTLCSGTGMQAIALDSEGNPISPRHICPDCALSALTGLAPPAAGEAHAPALPARVAPMLSIHLESSSAVTPAARGPPAVV